MMWPDMCFSEDDRHLDGQMSPEVNKERIEEIIGERVAIEVCGCQGRSALPELVKV